MPTISSLHDEAMDCAEQMIVARRRGDRKTARDAAERALELEATAAELASRANISKESQIILLKSAGHLAHDAGAFRRGEDFVIKALSLQPPDNERFKLFALLERLQAYSHLALRGVELASNEIQLSVAGPAIAPGLAPAAQVTTRIEQIRTLAWRTDLRKRGLPFDVNSALSRQVKHTYEPYVSTGREQSYAITLRFAVTQQLELSGVVDDAVTPDAVLEEVVNVVEDYSNGGLEAIRDRMPQSYVASTVALLEQIAPDLEYVSTVGITLSRNGVERAVALSPRKKIEPVRVALPKETTRQALPPREVEVIGELGKADRLKKHGLPVFGVETDDGKVVNVFFDESAHGDVIPTFWGKRVVVSTTRKGQVLTFVSIRLG